MAKKTEVKEGLTLYEEASDDGGKKLSFENATVDKQFIAKYGFKGGEPKALGTTKIEGEKWILSIHPGEKLPFVSGRWKGLSKSIACGPCSKEWQEKQAGAAKEGNKKELDSVYELCKSKGLKEGSSSEKVADLCQKSKVAFIDTNFLPLDDSLQAGWQKGEMKMYPFKRPKDWELLKDKGLKPQLFVNKVEPADVNQGALADCYLMGALGSAAAVDGFVKNETFGGEQCPELGIYRVSLCKNAWWQTVVVDDYLPCSGPKPAFARNRDEPNELWVALVEKAYSKANGTYFAMKTGQCSSALADLAGCPHKTLAMEEGLWDQVLSGFKQGCMLVLGTPGKNLMYVDEKQQAPDDKKMWEKWRSMDLICEHSYSLLKALKTKGGARLVCIRNPWGNTQHGLWKGKFKLDGDEWTPELKKECGYFEGPSADGVFWMSWEDCTQWFTSVSIGYLRPGWKSFRVKGEWSKGASNLLIEVDVLKKTSLWLSCHQSDTRGIKPGSSPDAQYANMQLYVTAKKKDGTPRIVESGGSNKRDYCKELTWDPEEKACGSKLYILCSPKDAATTKNYVISFMVADPSALNITFCKPNGSAPRYDTPKDIKYDDWSPGEFPMQVGKQTKTGSSVGAGKAKHADPEKKALKAKDTADLASAESPKKKASSRSKTAAASPGSAAKKLLDRELTMEIGVVSGKGLFGGGSQNPYCELKLREVKDGCIGSDHSNPQKQQTKVVNKDLSPSWGETFRFTVPGTDCINITVFGKKMMGKDFLGHVNLLMPKEAPGLTPGGEAEKKAIKLQGEEGRGEVSGSLTLSLRLVSVK